MDKFAVIILGSTKKEFMNERLRYAESILKGRKGIKVIFSGTKSEVEWMRRNTKLKGIIEDQSKTTYDNLINSKKFINKKERVFIITDNTHHLRTRYLATRILKGIPYEILSKKMPLSYHLKQLWYESTRFIHNVFH